MAVAGSSARQYGSALGLLTLLKLEVTWMFANLTWATVQAARGDPSGLGPAFLFIWLGLVGLTVAGYFVLSLRRR